MVIYVWTFNAANFLTLYGVKIDERRRADKVLRNGQDHVTDHKKKMWVCRHYYNSQIHFLIVKLIYFWLFQ